MLWEQTSQKREISVFIRSHRRNFDRRVNALLGKFSILGHSRWNEEKPSNRRYPQKCADSEDFERRSRALSKHSPAERKTHLRLSAFICGSKKRIQSVTDPRRRRRTAHRHQRREPRLHGNDMKPALVLLTAIALLSACRQPESQLAANLVPHGQLPAGTRVVNSGEVVIQPASSRTPGPFGATVVSQIRVVNSPAR
jgi:hypothetical protein